MNHLDTMVSGLERLGDISRWRGPLRNIPRHLFVPDRAWAAPDDEAGYLIDREQDPDAWLSAAYADMAIVTQLDDGATDVAMGVGEYTCSLSAPSVILAGLSLLNPGDGARVLEIGTGTGWTAGLLADQVGDENVTSIEIDRTVLATAAENLGKAGRSPLLILGDGAEGWPEEAPYDRVHVTCGVADIPYEWIRQTRPGGIIVLPWMPFPDRGQLTALRVGDDGTAVGRFYGEVNYMMLRAQRGNAREPHRDCTGTGLLVTPEGQRIWLDAPDNLL